MEPTPERARMGGRRAQTTILVSGYRPRVLRRATGQYWTRPQGWLWRLTDGLYIEWRNRVLLPADFGRRFPLLILLIHVFYIYEKKEYINQFSQIKD